jgi:prepilin-type N-terminal cleavage/methylation domain-containing protein
MSRSRRSGFTLIELLVVITIMGMLMAMIFPAFEQVRESMNKTKCQANLKSLSEAMLTLENTRNGFPGLVEPGQTSRESPCGVRATWCTSLLDAIDQKPLYASWFSTSGKNASAARFQVANVPPFVCPSDPPQGTAMQALSYVVNAGTIADGNASPMQVKTVNGVFFNRHPIYPASQSPPKLPARVSKSTCRNGANYVLMMTENIQAYQWADKRTTANQPTPYDDGRNNAIEAQQWVGFVRDGGVARINQAPPGESGKKYDEYDQAPTRQWSRPSSRHTEGVFVSFCSGTSRWLADSVEPHILEVLMCSDPAGAAKVPGSTLSQLARQYTPRDGEF